MNGVSCLWWWAVGGTLVTLIISLIAFFVVVRQRKHVAKFISDEVVEQNKSIPEIKLAVDLQRELQHIISDRDLPVTLEIKPRGKKECSVTLKSRSELAAKYGVTKAEAETIHITLRSRLKRDLVIADLAKITSIMALLLVGLSLVTLLRPSSTWDLVAVAIAPLAFVVVSVGGFFIGRFLAKGKVSKE